MHLGQNEGMLHLRLANFVQVGMENRHAFSARRIDLLSIVPRSKPVLGMHVNFELLGVNSNSAFTVP